MARETVKNCICEGQDSACPKKGAVSPSVCGFNKSSRINISKTTLFVIIFLTFCSGNRAHITDSGYNYRSVLIYQQSKTSFPDYYFGEPRPDLVLSSIKNMFL